MDTIEGEYCGRPSVLGNPFILHTEAERDLVCDRYQKWFDDKVAAKDKKIMGQLQILVELAKTDDLTLLCWCYPKRCHCETIKKYIEQQLE